MNNCVFLKRLSLFMSFAVLFSMCSCRLSEQENDGSYESGGDGSAGNDINDIAAENSDSEVENSGEEADKTKPYDYFAEIPNEDFGGREFIIVTTDPEFTDSPDSSGIIGGALNRRNRAIEEKFNIKITAVPADANFIQSSLQSAEISGTPYCDLLYAPMNTVSACGGNGLLMNIYSVPYFGFESEYADKNLIDLLSQSDTTYGVYGSAAYDGRSVWCVYYNKSVLNYLGFSDPYDMVKDGTWTWDMFLAIAEASVADLDGNGRMTRGADRYGYSSSMNTSLFANAVFASFGKNFFSRDDEGFYKMDFACAEDDDYVAKMREICVGNKSKYPIRDPGNEALEAFSDGRLTFFCEKLSYASTLAYSPAEWGILPMPKRNELQTNYYSWVDSSVCGYAVPQNVADSDISGKVLNAIYAYNFSYPENTIQLAWTYYYMRNNSSAAALEKIYENPVYDVAYAFGEGMADFSIASYGLLRSVMENNVNFSYLYSQNEAPFSSFIRQKFIN